MESVVRVGEWRGWRSARARLREWRQAPHKANSDLVLKLGVQLLKDHSSRLKSECEWCLLTHVAVLCVLCAMGSVGCVRAGLRGCF